MATPGQQLPPLPPGYTLDTPAQALPPLPPGYTLDQPQAQAQPQAQPHNEFSAAPTPFSAAWFKKKFYEGADALSNSLPAGGAMGGSMIGAGAGTAVEPGGGTALGAIGGAGIGGMAGEAARQHMRRILGFESPQNTQEAANQISQQGVVQGATQGLAESLPFLAPMLKKSAVGQYEKALAPTTKVNKAIVAQRTPEMIDRGITGSLGSIRDQAAQAADAIKPQLNEAYNATPASATQGSGWKILGDLQTLKSKYLVEGKVANPEAVNAINSVQDIVQQYGPDISPNSLRKLKSIFDDPVAQSGGYAGADLTSKYGLKAKSAAANSIRDLMGTANPDVAALNKEISFWLDVQRVAGQSALRRTGQAGGLNKVLSPLAGGVGASMGYAAGGAHLSIEAGTIATLTALAAQVMRSPAWKTSSSVLKDRFAAAVASGSVSDVAALAGRYGVAAARASDQPTSQRNQNQSPQRQ